MAACSRNVNSVVARWPHVGEFDEVKHEEASADSCSSPKLQARPKTGQFLEEWAWMRLSPRCSKKTLERPSPRAHSHGTNPAVRCPFSSPRCVRSSWCESIA